MDQWEQLTQAQIMFAQTNPLVQIAQLRKDFEAEAKRTQADIRALDAKVNAQTRLIQITLEAYLNLSGAPRDLFAEGLLTMIRDKFGEKSDEVRLMIDFIEHFQKTSQASPPKLSVVPDPDQAH
ncbi:MAG: hypothetical protein ABJM82_00055 [Shimia thalassica]|uniref:hypothetical protein n=1 Tax=Shimia thalassica TaxID=1715693 RepID=UPI0032969634